MSLDVLWTLPVRDDGSSSRLPFADTLVQSARGADLAGFHGVYLPYDPEGEDSWIAGAAIARETRHVTVVPEFPAGFASAVYTAKLSFTFQRFFAERLGWSLALNEPAAESETDRLLRAGELLSVAEGVWGEAPFDYRGRFFSVDGGALFASHRAHDVRAAARRFPTVYASGEDDAVLAFSAARADVHLFDTIALDALRERIERHRAYSAEAGRYVRYGLRLAVVAAEYESEAWIAAQRRWAAARPNDAGVIDAYRIDDVAWHGFTQIGYRFDGGVIGTYAAVAERLAAYAELGIQTFVVDAIPRIEEAYRLGEQLLPRLAERRLVAAR